MQVIIHNSNFKLLGTFIALQNLPAGRKFGSGIRIFRNVLFNVCGGNSNLICVAIFPVAVGDCCLFPS